MQFRMVPSTPAACDTEAQLNRFDPIPTSLDPDFHSLEEQASTVETSRKARIHPTRKFIAA